MLFNLGDKEILIIIGVFLIVTIGLSGLAAFSMKRWRRLWRGKGRGGGGDRRRA